MIGVVADDVTGANDIGGMFAKNGYRVEVLSGAPLRALPEADAVVLNTNSRADPREIAYSKVLEATRRLASRNPGLLMKKTCSAFRGNIGAEFDAMLDGADASFALVVAAFPKNGRVTRHGRHFVHGQPLSASQFALDPLHPMRDDDLRIVISRQSGRLVHLVDIDVVAAGPAAVRAAVESFRSAGGYAVCDTVTQEDLRTLGEACAGERLIFGSSAIAEELCAFRPRPGASPPPAVPPRNARGTLLIAGSVTPQTAAQIACLRSRGIGAQALLPTQLFDPQSRAEEVRRLTQSLEKTLTSGLPALVYSPGDPADVDAVFNAAAAAGLGRAEAGRTITSTLAEITRQVVERTGLRSLIVAGGETAGDVCSALGITGNRILEEIEPGVPLGLSRGRHELLMVLKAGGFGSPEFLLKALQRMEEDR